MQAINRLKMAMRKTAFTGRLNGILTRFKQCFVQKGPLLKPKPAKLQKLSQAIV